MASAATWERRKPVMPAREGPTATRMLGSASVIAPGSAFSARGVSRFPRAGTTGPWTLKMAYEQDVERLRHGPVEDPALRFTSARPAAVAS